MSGDDETPGTLPGTVRVGRVGLTVGSLDDVLPFYEEGLGFAVARSDGGAELRAGDATLVSLREDPSAPERSADEAGLYHLAIRVPDRGSLADALVRLRDFGTGLTGASDHLVSEALYLSDPEGNGIEIYRDRPREAWPRRADGGVEMDTLPLDLDALEAEATGTGGLPPGSAVGHVHLEVCDLGRAERFYADTLGLAVRDRYGDDATFLAAGDYHHHVGLNVWNHRRRPAARGRGLAWFELVLPDHDTERRLRGRLTVDGYPSGPEGGDLRVVDPDGNEVRLPVAEDDGRTA